MRKNEKVGKHISVPTKLSRQEQLDLCGQCHSTVTPLKDGQPFSFRPGDSFADHYEAPDPEKEGNGVHSSNQIARLAKSQCFQKTEMACADCHNPHKQERGEMALFSKRCLECHQVDNCNIDRQRTGDFDLAQNCVDCHMPVRATENLRFDVAEGSVFPPLRDHYIRVDERATEDFLPRLEN